MELERQRSRRAYVRHREKIKKARREYYQRLKRKDPEALKQRNHQQYLRSKDRRQ